MRDRCTILSNRLCTVPLSFQNPFQTLLHRPCKKETAPASGLPKGSRAVARVLVSFLYYRFRLTVLKWVLVEITRAIPLMFLERLCIAHYAVPAREVVKVIRFGRMYGS